MSVNKVILLGNVGRDPSIRYVGTRPVAEIALATSERAYTGPSGAEVPARTEWHRVVLWDANAETAEKYIRKGTRLYVEGKLRTRIWEDRNAIKNSVTEIYADHIEILSRSQS
ncbi:MAG: single-stranded DNA-binding protein [Paramuribaculum sp.]